MELAELGKTVAKYAPLLGTVLPIPGGAALGVAIAQAFGGEIEKPQELINKINADPEAALKLRTIESHEKLEIERLAVERLKVTNAGRADARNYNVEISKIPEDQRDKTPRQIAFAFIGGYFLLAVIVIAAIWSGTVNNEELNPITQLLKDMSYILMMVMSFYFGAEYGKNKN